MQNVKDMIIDMPVVASPPQELVNLINELIYVGEPHMANDIGPDVQPLVLHEALLDEQTRQIQLEEDAALADLLQDDFDEDAAEDSEFESVEEEVQEDEPMDGVEEEAVDSDAESVDNNPPDHAEDSSNSSDNDSDSDIDMSEVTLRRAMYVCDRFFRGVQRLLQLQHVKKCAVCVDAYGAFSDAENAAKTVRMMHHDAIVTCVTAARNGFDVSGIVIGFAVHFAGSGCARTAT